MFELKFPPEALVYAQLAENSTLCFFYRSINESQPKADIIKLNCNFIFFYFDFYWELFSLQLTTISFFNLLNPFTSSLIFFHPPLYHHFHYYYPDDEEKTFLYTIKIKTGYKEKKRKFSLFHLSFCVFNFLQHVYITKFSLLLS